MKQINLYYSSQFANAAAIHEEMAAMQTKAGNHRLAADSRQVAVARRIAGSNVSDSFPVKDALDYGDFCAKTISTD